MIVDLSFSSFQTKQFKGIKTVVDGWQGFAGERDVIQLICKLSLSTQLREFLRWNFQSDRSEVNLLEVVRCRRVKGAPSLKNQPIS